MKAQGVQVDWVNREAEGLASVAMRAARRARRLRKGSIERRRVERSVRQMADRVMFLAGVPW